MNMTFNYSYQNITGYETCDWKFAD